MSPSDSAGSKAFWDEIRQTLVWLRQSRWNAREGEVPLPPMSLDRALDGLRKGPTIYLEPEEAIESVEEGVRQP